MRVLWPFALVLLTSGSARARPPSSGGSTLNVPPLLPGLERVRFSTRTPRQKAEAGSALAEHLGPSVAERLLHSDEVRERLRGIDRLAANGNLRALQDLIHLLDLHSQSRAEERLAAVRALSAHAARPLVRQALIRVLTRGSQPAHERVDALDADIRQSAALALAASATPEAERALGKALVEQGPAARFAGAALEAYPPRDLEPLLNHGGPESDEFVRTLAKLGDQRAFSTLRRIVRRGPDPERAEAALALTELGDLETVELARHWLNPNSPTLLRTRAVQILALARTDDYPEAVARLIADPETRAFGVDLAFRAAHPRLVNTLALELEKSEAEAPLLVAAIGRAGGAHAARVLGRELQSGRHASAAAYALALMDGDVATAEIEGALRAEHSRLFAARAGVVLAANGGGVASGLRTLLERYLQSNQPAERATGAWGLCVLEPNRAAELVRSRDAATARAAARAAFSNEARSAAAQRLTRESDPLMRAALALSLLEPETANRVPTAALESLIDEVPAAAPLAVRALAMRDEPALRPHLENLLTSEDARLRAHAAQGLAYSAEPNASALLSRFYRAERLPSVRLAIVDALSRRAERAAHRTLELAASLDPDRDVRQSARLALGRDSRVTLRGSGSFWLELKPTESNALSSAEALTLETSSGVALPVVADPGGFLGMTGLPDGPVTPKLAGEAERIKALAR